MGLCAREAKEESHVDAIGIVGIHRECIILLVCCYTFVLTLTTPGKLEAPHDESSDRALPTPLQHLLSISTAVHHLLICGLCGRCCRTLLWEWTSQSSEPAERGILQLVSSQVSTDGEVGLLRTTTRRLRPGQRCGRREIPTEAWRSAWVDD